MSNNNNYYCHTMMTSRAPPVAPQIQKPPGRDSGQRSLQIRHRLSQLEQLGLGLRSGLRAWKINCLGGSGSAMRAQQRWPGTKARTCLSNIAAIRVLFLIARARDP